MAGELEGACCVSEVPSLGPELSGGRAYRVTVALGGGVDLLNPVLSSASWTHIACAFSFGRKSSVPCAYCVCCSVSPCYVPVLAPVPVIKIE